MWFYSGYFLLLAYWVSLVLISFVEEKYRVFFSISILCFSISILCILLTQESPERRTVYTEYFRLLGSLQCPYLTAVLQYDHHTSPEILSTPFLFSLEQKVEAFPIWLLSSISRNRVSVRTVPKHLNLWMVVCGGDYQHLGPQYKFF